MDERWVFTFSVTGDLRFISHRDTLRLLQRAVARADLPVRFSEGYNPHPRIAIPLPRPVGVASDDEAVVIEFERIIDGIRIQLGVEEAKHMVLWHDGAWEEHHAEADEHHIELVLEDPNVDAHASKILYSDVVLAVAKDGIALSSTSLTPMYTSHGFHYGGNFGLAEAGDYQITVTAGTPTFARSESTQDKWKQPISVTFEYSFAGGPLTEEIEIGEIETQGLKVELEAKGPERMWMQMAGDSHWIEPATGATHHFEVKLEDPAVDAHAEFIGYAEIHVTIVNDATGEESGEIELHPMYGDHGLHYGANFHLPDGHDEPDDDDHHNE